MSQGPNLYAYGRNDPITVIDPLGTDTYWHDMQDTMAGFIGGFIPGLPYDPSNDAMRYGREIGLGTNIALGVDALLSGALRTGASLLGDVGSVEGLDAIGGAGSDVGGLGYNPRCEMRAADDPLFHDFPYSFDPTILEGTPMVQADGSLLYQSPGSIYIPGSVAGTGQWVDGVYQLGVNPETNMIFHRAFQKY